MKKMGESTNEVLQMFGETSPNKLLFLPKKYLYNLIKQER